MYVSRQDNSKKRQTPLKHEIVIGNLCKVICMCMYIYELRNVKSLPNFWKGCVVFFF